MKGYSTTSSDTPNPFRDGARLQKCITLTDLFTKFRYTVEQVERMMDKEWAMVAEAAGVRVPSVAVREMVVNRMKELEANKQ